MRALNLVVSGMLLLALQLRADMEAAAERLHAAGGGSEVVVLDESLQRQHRGLGAPFATTPLPLPSSHPQEEQKSATL